MSLKVWKPLGAESTMFVIHFLESLNPWKRHTLSFLMYKYNTTSKVMWPPSVKKLYGGDCTIHCFLMNWKLKPFENITHGVGYCKFIITSTVIYLSKLQKSYDGDSTHTLKKWQTLDFFPTIFSLQNEPRLKLSASKQLLWLI